MSNPKRPDRNAENTPVSPITHTRRTVIEWLGQGAAVAMLPPALTGCFPAEPKDRCCTGDHSEPVGDTSPSQDSDPPDTLVDPDCPQGSFDFTPSDADTELWDEFVVFTADPQDLDALLADWVLTIDGMVDRPMSFTFQELVAMARLDQVMDFHCVTGWSVQDVTWNGVHMQTLLDAVGVRSTATHITFHTVNSIYNESLPLEVALEPHTMLAYGVCGATLPLDHGFPLRLVIPRLLGYKNAKYVQRLELTDAPIQAYWEQRGYGYDAEVPPARLREGRY